MLRRWFSNIRVFLAWLVGFGLTFVILGLLHELFMVFIVNTLHWQKYTVRFFNMLYYFPAGLILIAYIVLIYAYLNRSAGRGLLLKSSLRVIGIQLLIIALIQVCLIAYEFYSADLLFTILVAVEFFVGGSLLILGSNRLNLFIGSKKENHVNSR